MKNLAYLVALLILLSGCSSQIQRTVEYELSQLSNEPNNPTEEQKLSCVDWTQHVVAIDKRGRFAPVKFTIPDDDRKDSKTDIKNGCDPATNLDIHLDNIVNSVRVSGRKKLLIFIHGGMNGYKSSLKRVERDLPKMMKDRDTYPIFVVWPSEMFDSYGDSIANYYQGSWDHRGYFLSVPFMAATDLAEVGTRSVLSYGKQTNLLLGSTCFNEYWRGFLPLYCGPNPNKPAFAEIKPTNGQRNQNGDERNPTNDPCEEADPPRGYSCVKTSAKEAGDFWRLKNILLSPLKLISVPVIDPLGERDWNSMISRTRFAMRQPCKDDVWAKGNCEAGPAYKLFKIINEKLQDREITLIGHSMGAIVASEAVNAFPDLPYRNVVFMGAAVSVREFSKSVQRVLKERVLKEQGEKTLINANDCARDKVGVLGNPDEAKRKPFYFFNLSLHPYAEATEENGYGAAPSGSLLEWIDTNFTQPADIADRTLGRWANISPLRYILDQDLLNSGYMHFKRFGLDFNGPHSHGGLANPDARDNPEESEKKYGVYWNPEYWL
ncbi:MAG: hypothetical protein ACR65O_01310 [Methylomicrobium sp.]